MDNERTRKVLQELIDAYPKPLSIYHLGVSKSEPKSVQQEFRNFLMELKQRGFIEATPSWGMMRETYGMILDIFDIKITKEGRKFMDGRNEQAPTSQVINIGTASGPLNIAARDINITNNADAEKVIEKLLDLIEKANLPDEKKKSLVGSVKSMISQVAPNFLVMMNHE